MAITLRINVLDLAPLDGATALTLPVVTPATDVDRKDLGIREITLPVGTAFGRLDLGALFGESGAWQIRHLAVESEVGGTFTHLAGSEVRLRGPALPDGTFAPERVLVDLADTNFNQGVIAEGMNEPLPVGHDLVFDTAADLAGSGPHVVQVTIDGVLPRPDKVAGNSGAPT